VVQYALCKMCRKFTLYKLRFKSFYNGPTLNGAAVWGTVEQYIDKYCSIVTVCEEGGKGNNFVLLLKRSSCFLTVRFSLPPTINHDS